MIVTFVIYLLASLPRTLQNTFSEPVTVDPVVQYLFRLTCYGPVTYFCLTAAAARKAALILLAGKADCITLALPYGTAYRLTETTAATAATPLPGGVRNCLYAMTNCLLCVTLLVVTVAFWPGLPSILFYLLLLFTTYLLPLPTTTFTVFVAKALPEGAAYIAHLPR